MIARAGQALARLEALYAGFPAAPLRAAFHEFRACDDAFRSPAGEAMNPGAKIPGTKGKGRAVVRVSGREIRRIFPALCRGTELFRGELTGFDRPDLHRSNVFPGPDPEGTTLTLPGLAFWPVDGAAGPDHA